MSMHIVATRAAMQFVLVGSLNCSRSQVTGVQYLQACYQGAGAEPNVSQGQEAWGRWRGQWGALSHAPAKVWQGIERSCCLEPVVGVPNSPCCGASSCWPAHVRDSAEHSQAGFVPKGLMGVWQLPWSGNKQ